MTEEENQALDAALCFSNASQAVVTDAFPEITPMLEYVAYVGNSFFVIF